MLVVKTQIGVTELDKDIHLPTVFLSKLDIEFLFIVLKGTSCERQLCVITGL